MLQQRKSLQNGVLGKANVPTTHSLHNPHAVYADGSICLDILQNQWSPIYDVSAILTSIQARVHCPS